VLEETGLNRFGCVAPTKRAAKFERHFEEGHACSQLARKGCVTFLTPCSRAAMGRGRRDLRASMPRVSHSTQNGRRSGIHDVARCGAQEPLSAVWGPQCLHDVWRRELLIAVFDRRCNRKSGYGEENTFAPIHMRSIR